MSSFLVEVRGVRRRALRSGRRAQGCARGRDRVGGTCLHRGCIPAKELLQTAEVVRTARFRSEFGVTVGEASVDLSVSQERKYGVINRLTSGLEGLLKKRTVTVIGGTGSIIDAAPRHVRVSDGTELITTRGAHPCHRFGTAVLAATRFQRDDRAVFRPRPGLDRDSRHRWRSSVAARSDVSSHPCFPNFVQP